MTVPTVDELKAANGGHNGKHPGYPPEDWRYLVANGETRLGYWEWVQHEIELAGDDTHG